MTDVSFTCQTQCTVVWILKEFSVAFLHFSHICLVICVCSDVISKCRHTGRQLVPGRPVERQTGGTRRSHGLAVGQYAAEL